MIIDTISRFKVNFSIYKEGEEHETEIDRQRTQNVIPLFEYMIRENTTPVKKKER